MPARPVSSQRPRLAPHRAGPASRATLAAAALATCALAASPRAARADDLLRDPRTGIEGALDLGYGAFSNGAAFSHVGRNEQGVTRGSFGFQLHGGYRLIPVLSVGAHFTFNVLSFRSDITTGNPSASAAAVGVYVRLHPLDFLAGRDRTSVGGRFDPYLGVGWDFYAPVSGSYSVGPFTGTTSSNGFAFPVTLGLDFALHPNVALGLMGQWSPWTSFQVCSTNQLFGSTVVCDSPREAEHYFFIGAGVRVHFNVLH